MDYFKNVAYLISHVFLMLFIYLFTVHRYSKKKTMGICFGSFLVLCIVDCLKLNIFPNSDVCYLIVTVFQILVTQSTAVFIARNRDSKALFMGLSSSNYVIAGSVAASVLYIYTSSQFLALIGSFMVHLVILLFLSARIRTIWLKSYEKEYVENWWELCFIPIFFYCGFSFLAFFPNTLYENPDNIPGTMIFIITMFVSYVVVLRYIESERDNVDIYWKNVLFESYIKGLENQYSMVEQSEYHLKILRHDMRHYSQMIDALLKQGEYDEIGKIIDYINDVVDENRVVKYCDNLMINVILSTMMEKAHSLDIAIQSEILVPRDIVVNDYEFASVIANLFENALISVKDFEKERKWIDLKIHYTDADLLIQTKNEYEGEIIFDSETGLPKSRKSGNHGFGMQSALVFSERIGGSIGCYCDSGVFRIILYAKF